MDCNRDGGEGWMVRGWHALTFVVECEVLALTLNPRTPMANLIRSLRGGASACRAAPAPSQGNQTKARWLWEAPLTAQRASAEAPFPQPNDAVCPVPVHVPRATTPKLASPRTSPLLGTGHPLLKLASPRRHQFQPETAHRLSCLIYYRNRLKPRNVARCTRSKWYAKSRPSRLHSEE